MNVYDFDDTIFRGDSTRAFWAYCLKRAPGLARFLPRQCAAAVRYALGRTAKEAFKEAFFSFLQGVPDADAWAEDFWRTHERRFRPWYLAQKQPDDLVVSRASTARERKRCRVSGSNIRMRRSGSFIPIPAQTRRWRTWHAVPFWSGEILTPHGRCNAPFPRGCGRYFQHNKSAP